MKCLTQPAYPNSELRAGSTKYTVGPEKSRRAVSAPIHPSLPDRPALAQAMPSLSLPPIALLLPVHSHTRQGQRSMLAWLQAGRVGYAKRWFERWSGAGNPCAVTLVGKCKERAGCCALWPGLLLTSHTIKAWGWERRVRLRRTGGRGAVQLGCVGTVLAASRKLPPGNQGEFALWSSSWYHRDVLFKGFPTNQVSRRTDHKRRG